MVKIIQLYCFMHALLCVNTARHVQDVVRHEYPRGSVACKLFNTSWLDCSQRKLNTTPQLPVNITSVDLSRNEITNVSEISFRGQSYLISVELYENLLRSIDDSPFKWLNCLQWLDLSYTRLETLAVSSFQGLYNLNVLILRNNRLRSLPKNIFEGLSKLRVLTIRDNILTNIPSQEIAPLQSLEYLNMIDNDFTDFNFGKGFTNLTSLSTLKIFSNNLTSSNNNTADAKEISKTTRERYVYISNQTLENLAQCPIANFAIGFQYLPNVNVTVDSGIYAPMKNLTYLIVYDWVHAVPSVQSELESMTTFIFTSDMKLSNESLQFAAHFKTSLQSLDLSTSYVNGIYGSPFEGFSNLRTLILNTVLYSLQYISDEAFNGLSHLEQLHLADNQINKLPVKAFKAFENGKLTFLDLSYNSLNGYFPDESFSSLKSLTHLFLSGNPIWYIGPWIHMLTNLQQFRLDYLTTHFPLAVIEWTVPLPTVSQLYLTSPARKNILIAYSPLILANHVPNIETLSIYGAYIERLEAFNNLHFLTYLDASESFSVMKDFESSWGRIISLINVQNLKLASNRIGNVGNMKLNMTVPNVSVLDLSKNKIHAFSSTDLQYLQQLEQLYLRDNHLISLDNQNGLMLLPKIQILDLSYNAVTEIPNKFIEAINDTLLILNAGGNPFACTCAIEPFRRWILIDSNTFLSPESPYICKTPSHLSGMSITQINLDCTSHLLFYIGIGVASALTSLLLLLIVMKYRWHIKYRLFLLCTWRRKYQPIEDDEHDINVNGVRYDAFVSYAHENERDLHWVLNELRKNIEDTPEPFRLCIGHARDFIPGSSLLDVITEAIHQSRKTIIVLSPSYLESEWCYFETQHAWLRLLNEGKDVIIMVLLDPIPDAKMTMWLRQFLCKKACLRWPQDKAAQKLFFRYLRELMKSRTVVNRRYDI